MYVFVYICMFVPVLGIDDCDHCKLEQREEGYCSAVFYLRAFGMSEARGYSKVMYSTV